MRVASRTRCRAALLTALALIGASLPASATRGAGTRPRASAARGPGPDPDFGLDGKARLPDRAAPRAGARVTARAGTVAAWDGGPVALLVLAARRDADDRVWLRVRLPDRPNGRSGWIDADFARLRQTPWRLEIDRGRRRATAYRAGHRARSWRVAVGKSLTPTPRGLFAVYERVRQPAGSVLGPFARLHPHAEPDHSLACPTGAAGHPGRSLVGAPRPGYRRIRRSRLVRDRRLSSRRRASPISQNIGGHSPMKSARRSALPRSSSPIVFARIQKMMQSPILPMASA